MNYSNKDLTKLVRHTTGRDIDSRSVKQGGRGIENFDVKSTADLAAFSILFDESDERRNARTLDLINSKSFQLNSPEPEEKEMVAFDSLQASVLTASVTVPIQKLQYWIPGVVSVLTAPRKADALMGYMQAGTWDLEQVIIQNVEYLGSPNTYGDYTRNPLASFGNGFTIRNIVRFQQGMKVSILESMRTAQMELDDAGMKRKSCSYNLDIVRNSISFLGFLAGANSTYGFLNAPELSSYVQVASGVAGRTWPEKTTNEIISDLLTAYAALISSSQGYVVEGVTPITLALPTESIAWLNQTTQYNMTVKDWLLKTMPTLRIVDAVQLQDAYLTTNNVFYLYADSVDDGGMSTDGGQVWYNGGPTKLMLLGTQQLTDGFEERYSNAMFGAICPRPFAVVRFYGI